MKKAHGLDSLMFAAALGVEAVEKGQDLKIIVPYVD